MTPQHLWEVTLKRAKTDATRLSDVAYKALPMGQADAIAALDRFADKLNRLDKFYGVGYIQKIRGEQAKVEFNPSVFMQPPYRSENKILIRRRIALQIGRTHAQTRPYCTHSRRFASGRRRST